MNGKSKRGLMVDLDSKLWKTFLVFLAALLTFVGPYIVYVLVNVLKIGYVTSMVIGIFLFFTGLWLIRYLIKNKVIR